MTDFTKSTCSDISRMFSIGKSVDGQDLWVLEISSNPGVIEPKPNFKYVANIHGDETSGRQLLLKLADWLCKEWKTDKRAALIVDGMHLFLMPSMNPDGFSLLQRNNREDVDLNRNFPDRFEKTGKWMQPKGNEAAETLAMIEWIKNGFFVGSACLHEGALVANYPWDANKEGDFKYAASPDDETFVYLAKIYANSHTTMHLNEEFDGGITNGNDWYPVYGGMQDFNYIIGDCSELTLELNEKKNPVAKELPRLWEENKDAFLDFAIATAFSGFRGLVYDKNKKPLLAQIKVKGITKIHNTRLKFGDFYRPLKPGNYTVLVGAKGYETEQEDIIVPRTGTGVMKVYYLNEAEANRGSQFRTMNASEVNPVDWQNSFFLNIFYATAITLCVTYGIQKLRKRTRSRPSRLVK